MARIEIQQGQLIVRVDGLLRVLTTREAVSVPLTHITTVEARAEPPRSWLEHLKHLTTAGTHIPGVLQVGTFVAKDGLIFYAVRSGGRAIAIELERERFRRLVVEPPSGEDPDDCVARIREAVARARASA